ncbi:RCC1 domain-containing protein, partial [Pseudomonas huaxiensis]|uniref:RCC1 domain-containing protein n=1 Tax=Pseudomonas huaxiensis TaxID=2213017 RepID=UPI00384F62EC
YETQYVVPVGGAGQPVRVTVPYAVINANAGQVIHLKYKVARSAGGPEEESPVNPYNVNREIGSGPLLVMGARFNASTYRASSAPRMLSAFHRTTLQPMLAEWRYEDSQVWTAKPRWFDNKPWLKLYVRTSSDAVLLNPANIIGNGVDTTANGAAAFIAMRDEVTVGTEKEVDMVGWGNAAHGGALDPTIITIRDIVEVSCTSNAYAARRRNGSVVCWGTAGGGGTMPPGESGDYVQVRSNSGAFVGQKRDGRLITWGTAGSGVPVPPEVELHKDYVELYGAGMAFAARRATGHVVAWGNAAHGGVLLPGQGDMSDIVQVIGSYGAFAALRDGGGSQSVIAWGSPTYGGAAPPEIAQLTNVKALGAATAQAFSILLATNAVRGWGAASHGGTVPETIQSMTNVVEVSSTWHAFCARLSNGSVVAWGNPTNGGAVPEPIARLSNIVQVVGSSWSFAALCRDGKVVAWGVPATGGDISAVAG